MPVIELHVSPGDIVAVDDPLVTLESDKATMDVPAPFAGVVRDIRVGVGDVVSHGTVLLSIEPSSSDEMSGPPPRAAAIASEWAPSEASAPDSIVTALEAEEPPPATPGGDGAAAAESSLAAPVYASPSVRRRARELGIDLHGVTGTGRKGRITLDDLEQGAATPPSAAPAASPGLAPWPSLDFSKQGPVERVPRTRIQKIAAPNLARNWALIPTSPTTTRPTSPNSRRGASS